MLIIVLRKEEGCGMSTSRMDDTKLVDKQPQEKHAKSAKEEAE